MKQMMFSRSFPADHPRKGEATYFVEKIALGLIELNRVAPERFPASPFVIDVYTANVNDLLQSSWLELTPKYHTIRSGKRWKVGDLLVPKSWRDKPYRSKTDIFLPPVKVVKTWDFKVDERGASALDGKLLFGSQIYELAKNDGLSYDDFEDWLIVPCHNKRKPFDGQIICWNPFINY